MRLENGSDFELYYVKAVFFSFLTFRKYIIGLVAVVAGVKIVNVVLEHQIQKSEEDEIEEERVMVEQLKKTLPESTLKKYGLSKY